MTNAPKSGRTEDGGAGRRLSYWLSETLKALRQDAGIEEDDVARILKVDRNTVRRIEREESFDRNKIDSYLAGYAFILGMDDPRDLWDLALDRWWAEGAPPEFKAPDGLAEAFARAIRDQARRTSQSRGERSESRTSIRKKQAELQSTRPCRQRPA
jgi:transcriptional regulator with XRE-family HTH domain